MKREPIPQSQVLTWLKTNHEHLHEVAVIERAWIWLPVDLRGKENDSTRDSLMEYGFRFARRGHPLSNGKVGTWSHACDRPIPFKMKGKGNKPKPESGGRVDPLESQREEQEPESSSEMDEAAAFFARL